MRTHSLKLIDNTYELEIASRLVDQLFESKIRFVEDQINSVKGPMEVIQLESRLEELKVEKRSIDILFDDYDGEHAISDISCKVMMNVRKVEAA